MLGGGGGGGHKVFLLYCSLFTAEVYDTSCLIIIDMLSNLINLFGFGSVVGSTGSAGWS